MIKHMNKTFSMCGHIRDNSQGGHPKQHDKFNLQTTTQPDKYLAFLLSSCSAFHVIYIKLIDSFVICPAMLYTVHCTLSHICFTIVLLQFIVTQSFSHLLIACLLILIVPDIQGVFVLGSLPAMRF